MRTTILIHGPLQQLPFVCHCVRAEQKADTATLSANVQVIKQLVVAQVQTAALRAHSSMASVITVKLSGHPLYLGNKKIICIERDVGLVELKEALGLVHIPGLLSWTDAVSDEIGILTGDDWRYFVDTAGAPLKLQQLELHFKPVTEPVMPAVAVYCTPRPVASPPHAQHVHGTRLPVNGGPATTCPATAYAAAGTRLAPRTRVELDLVDGGWPANTPSTYSQPLLALLLGFQVADFP